jgi:hypothetical protein
LEEMLIQENQTVSHLNSILPPSPINLTTSSWPFSALQ